jgi:hypothetical protein
MIPNKIQIVFLDYLDLIKDAISWLITRVTINILPIFQSGYSG